MPAKNIIPGQKISKEKLERARELRSEMTPAEKILWEELRGNKLGVHLNAIRAGDQEAFAQLVDPHHSQLLTRS